MNWCMRRKSSRQSQTNWTKLSLRCLDTEKKQHLLQKQLQTNQQQATRPISIFLTILLSLRSFPSAIVYYNVPKKFRWVRVAEFTKNMNHAPYSFPPRHVCNTSKPWFLTKSLRLFLSSPSHDTTHQIIIKWKIAIHLSHISWSWYIILQQKLPAVFTLFRFKKYCAPHTHHHCFYSSRSTTLHRNFGRILMTSKNEFRNGNDGRVSRNASWK